MEQLRQIATKEDLEANRQNIHKYIDGHVQVQTIFIMLQKEIETSSKYLYLDAMEARVWFHPDTITWFRDVIAKYKAWHHYVIDKHQVEVVELEFPQTQLSYCFVLLGCQVVSTLFFLIRVRV